MAERVPIPKKIRFEVLKRDKFTCQYCGRKAPEVLLQIDHIESVYSGGDNNIINLITSCADCNNGKGAIKLSDNTALEKQRNQLELLADRREQIEMMFEWKKSLSSLDNDVLQMLVDYVESKISPYTLNATGRANIQKLIKKHQLEDILDTIDQASEKYLRYEDDKPTQESVETFLGKIGGFLHYKKLPPVQQKLSYIKGIGRNRFSYWDDRAASILLNNYVKALEEADWDEEDILEDLNKEVAKITKEAKNWSAWKSLLEKWIDDIKGWGKEEVQEMPKAAEEPLRKVFTNDDMLLYSNVEFHDNLDKMEAICYIGKIFPAFKEEAIKRDTVKAIITYLRNIEINDCLNDTKAQDELAEEAIEAYELMRYFEYSDEFHARENHTLKYEHLKGCTYDMLKQMFYTYNVSYYGLEQVSFKLKADMNRCDIHLETMDNVS